MPNLEAAPLQKLEFLVDGMKCSQCLWKIEKALANLPDVTNVEVDLSRKTVSLSGKEDLKSEDVLQRIQNAGFSALKLDGLEDRQALLRKANLKSLIQLVVAGTCAGNIMLLAVSLYAGADESSFSSYFGWLSFLLFLPVLLYSSSPFFEGTWRAFKSRQINIDVSMALVLVAGTSLSLLHLLRKTGDTYFDSMSALVFLLLTSRYIVQRLQQKAQSPNLLEPFLKVRQVRVWNTDQNQWLQVALKEVSPGDLIQVSKDEILAVDGRLEGSAPVYINASLFSGESYPQKILPGQKTFAGVRLVSEKALVRVESTQAHTRLGKLFSEMRTELKARTPLISLMDRWARYFTVTVITLAGLFFVLYSFIDVVEAAKRSLALIILACPCALALGVPLTQSLSLYRAIRQGIILKKAESLEKLSKIKTLFFDKTGTLTEGEIRVISSMPQRPSAKIRSVILALEKNSEHPIGRSLAFYFNSAAPIELTDWAEVPGRGVQGTFENRTYELCKAKKLFATHPHASVVELFEDGRSVAHFELGDKTRPDSAKTLAQLRQQFQLKLLTGDQKNVAQRVGSELGFKPDEILSDLSPENKLSLLKESPSSVMVGDGVNDAPSMAAADVAIAVHGSMEASLHAADVYLTHSGVSQVTELFSISSKAEKTVRRILGFSLMYNLFGASLALAGFVNPLLAAILMPVSSLFVSLIAWSGTR